MRSGCRMSSPRRAASDAAGLIVPEIGPLGGVLFDVIDRVLDGPDLLGILVRDLGPKLFLEAHDELDQVEGISVEIVDEGGLRLDLVLVDAELLNDDLLETLVGGGH